MKKIISLILSIMLFTGVMMAIDANSDPLNTNMIIKIREGSEVGTINLNLANLQEKRTYVILRDIDGRVWFSKNIWKQHAYAKSFNMTGMPDGNYMLYVRNKDVFEVRMFVMNENSITFYEDENGVDRSSIAAFVNNSFGNRGNLIIRFTEEDENRLGVQLTNLEGKETKIRFCMLQRGTLKVEKVEGEAGYAKTFNTSGLGEDYGFFFVEIGNEFIVQFFQISDKEVSLGKKLHFDPAQVENDLVAK